MGRKGEDRILTVPNGLSVVRLLLLPVFVWLVFGPESRFTAAILLAALGVRDGLDGYIARHFDQESKLGRALDPMADRILLAVGGVAILVDNSIPRWLGGIIIAREVVVAAFALFMAVKGALNVEVSLVGKAGNFLNMVAFPLFLAGNPDGGAPWAGAFRALGWLAAVPGVALSYYAAFGYIKPARKALTEARLGSGQNGEKPSVLSQVAQDGQSEREAQP
jgi:cardiolipin synthase